MMYSIIGVAPLDMLKETRRDASCVLLIVD